MRSKAENDLQSYKCIIFESKWTIQNEDLHRPETQLLALLFESPELWNSCKTHASGSAVILDFLMMARFLMSTLLESPKSGGKNEFQGTGDLSPISKKWVSRNRRSASDPWKSDPGKLRKNQADRVQGAARDDCTESSISRPLVVLGKGGEVQEYSLVFL